MPRAIDVGVMPSLCRVLDVRRRDRDAAGALFRCLVDLIERHEVGHALAGLNLGDRRRQCRLAVVDVADRPDVHVRLRALELLACHADLTPYWRDR